MNAQSPKPAGPSLSISGTLAEVYHLLWDSRDDFLRLALIPVAASFVLMLAAVNLAARDERIILVILAADMIPATLFAVRWHRLILLGPRQAAPGIGVRWSNRETAYLWRSLVLVVGVLLATAIPGSIALAIAQRSAAGSLVALLVFLAALLLMLRLALVLPASAVDAPYGFAQSWNDTAARGLRLAAIALLVGTPLVVGLHLLNGLVATTGLAAAAPFTFLLLNSIGTYVFFAAVLTVVSLAFRRLSGWRSDPPAAALPGS